jgi:hypothetical protein
MRGEEKEKGRGYKDTGLTNKKANNTGKVGTVFIMCGIESQ